MASDEQKKEELLNWAEGEAKNILSICNQSFGEISVKTSKALLLLADVYRISNRYCKTGDSCVHLMFAFFIIFCPIKKIECINISV